MTANFEQLSKASHREVAADWLQRLSKRGMSEEDVQAWLQWYGASDANRQAFDETQAFYVHLRGMNSRQRTRLRAVLPEVHSLTHRSSLSRNTGFWAVAACIAVSLVLGVWRLVELPSQVLAFAAPIDHYRTVPLADGSAMVLSARAAATVSYTRKARALEMLQGAAYFQVKPDSKRPFVVRAGEVTVTAIGTAFSVTREADKLSVTVTEGTVDVVRELSSSIQDPAAPSKKRLRMKTGERTEIAVVSAALPVVPPSSGTNSWQNGSVQFFNTPLGDVIDAVNTQSSFKILIEDPRVTDLNYSGTVFRERISEWLDALPQIYPVRKVPLSGGGVTLVLRAGE